MSKEGQSKELAAFPAVDELTSQIYNNITTSVPLVPTSGAGDYLGAIVRQSEDVNAAGKEFVAKGAELAADATRGIHQGTAVAAQGLSDKYDSIAGPNGELPDTSEAIDLTLQAGLVMDVQRSGAVMDNLTTRGNYLESSTEAAAIQKRIDESGADITHCFPSTDYQSQEGAVALVGQANGLFGQYSVLTGSVAKVQEGVEAVFGKDNMLQAGKAYVGEQTAVIKNTVSEVNDNYENGADAETLRQGSAKAVNSLMDKLSAGLATNAAANGDFDAAKEHLGKIDEVRLGYEAQGGQKLEYNAPKALEE